EPEPRGAADQAAGGARGAGAADGRAGSRGVARDGVAAAVVPRGDEGGAVCRVRPGAGGGRARRLARSGPVADGAAWQRTTPGGQVLLEQRRGEVPVARAGAGGAHALAGRGQFLAWQAGSG